MSEHVRSGVVAEIVIMLAGDAPAAVKLRDVAALHPTHAERVAAGEALAKAAVGSLIEAGALVPVAAPSILSLDWRELSDLATRHLQIAHAYMWLLDQVGPRWVGVPGRLTLGDRLKIEPAERLRELAAEMRAAGVHDLDDDGPAEDVGP
jgi:hypothetical protein